MGEFKNILLTGGEGFIGRNILEQISSKYNITAPAHQDLDLLDTEKTAIYLKNHKFDVIIHAAGTGVSRAGSQDKIFDVNTKMFLNLVNNSEKFGRMIFLGSGAEYGKQQPIVKVTERDFGKILPEDEYGKAKYFASEYILKHPKIVNLRCFGVFGKYEDYTIRFISNIICQSLAGQQIVVSKNTVFDYIYIDDLVKIVSFFIEHEPKAKFYNVGRGQCIELMELAKVVKELTKNPYDIQIKQSGMGKEYTCNNSILLNEIGDFEFTPIKKAVQEMIDWYRDNWQSINQDELISNI